MNAKSKSIPRSFFVESGRKGGSAGRGKAKARSSKHARHAAMQRWKKAQRSDKFQPTAKDRVVLADSGSKGAR